MPDSATAGLIFASDQANHNFARVLGDLRRARLSIHHRLRSIRRDAAFIAAVADRYPGLSLVANERCGSWYIPTGRTDASAYFKSTDGHTGQWAVSTRRLNLHLLALSSFVLVDSTRRGKRMPDALSKTVPLWCCAINRVVFDPEAPLYTPPGVVSPSEHSQMLARVPSQADGLRRVGVLDNVAEWRSRLHGRPLRPVWVTPDMPWPDLDGLTDRFTVVVCCTASCIPGEERNSEDVDTDTYTYIQGAADDTENWAHGLTPALFWAHGDELLVTPEADLPARMEALVAAQTSVSSVPTASAAPATTSLAITPYLSVGVASSVALSDGTCDIVFVRQTTSPDTWACSSRRLEVGLGRQDKAAARSLRYALPQICAFVSAYLAANKAPQVRVLCDSGRDISVGAALALLCACFDAAGQPPTPSSGLSPSPVLFTKDAIRVRLGRIMTAMPLANPSRTTLQSVNSFLMG